MRALIALCLALFLLLPAATHAQDESRLLTPGQSVDGVIDADHLLQMYRFTQGSASNEVATLANTGARALSLTVTDAAGSHLAALSSVAAGAQAVLSWPTASGGVYYLLVIPLDAPEAGTGAFRLSLSGVAAEAASAPTPAPVIPAGSPLQFSLTWQAGARLSLEIRDPQGQSVHWNNIQSADGGAFSGDTDAVDCAAFTPHLQSQAVRWAAPPAGSYEILVHYIEGCETSIPFSVSVRLGSVDFPALSSTLPSDSTFVGGFVVGADGRAALNARSGIVGADAALTIPTADLLANAQPLPADGAAQGRISSDQPYVSYQFQGELGAVISASVQRTSGSLDTLLVLMDNNGNLVALNDDAGDGTTDSAIADARLRRGGTYLLIVTRYAQLLGATEGDFALTVSGVVN